MEEAKDVTNRGCSIPNLVTDKRITLASGLEDNQYQRWDHASESRRTIHGCRVLAALRHNSGYLSVHLHVNE